MSHICFIDFETTGRIPEIHFPLQLGAVLMDEKDHTVLNQFSQYIIPPSDCIISPKALEVNGLDPFNMPEGAVFPKKCLEMFFKEFGFDYRFSAWNINFDVSFFRKLGTEYDFIRFYSKIDYHHLDVQSIVQHLRLKGRLPEIILSLNNALDYYGLGRKCQKHDAFEDTDLLRQLYCVLP